MYYHIYKSEIGKIYLVSKGHALCGCYLENQKNFPKEILNYQKDDSLKIFIEATNWLERYFKGENVENNEISLEVNGTDFRRNVWNIIKGIPGVKHAERFAYKQGILKTDNDFLGVMLKGVGPEFDSTFIHQNLISGTIPQFSDDKASDKIIISKNIADNQIISIYFK